MLIYMNTEIIKNYGNCINIRKNDDEPEVNSLKNQGE